MVGLIDLNTTEEEEETTPSSGSLFSSSSSASNAAAPSSPSSAVCLELWHACAGPLISLPKKGSLVAYLPQGHLEQLPPTPTPPASAGNLPPHLFCRVVDVKLHAEAATDEVYAQVSLVPENEQTELKLRRKGRVEGCDGDEEDAELAVKASTPHMFCKTLTASDTSTHGGFSVPRRAAEDCFPPLRPSQELVAKDLHGFEWRFRHIYRGQPRRHLLTTGWSAFVNKKKLVSGDAVLFLRGEDGELRLGVRRAAQVKPSATLPVFCSQLSSHSSIADVANAVALGSVFSVCYNPRASSSEFVIPLNKFVKSLDYSFCAGMRFKMRFETEDAAERRCSGMITGISDLDPVRWPRSKWRCLMVRWDDMEVTRNSRVSPWEIEASGSVSSSFLGSGLKRTRSALPEYPVPDTTPDGIGASDFGESSTRFHKVLQGQEISSINTLFEADARHNHHHHEGQHRSADQMRCFRGHGLGTNNNAPPQHPSHKGIGFGESVGFHRVLQGQEIFPSSPYSRAPHNKAAHDNNGCLGILPGLQIPGITRNGWSSTTMMHPPGSHQQHQHQQQASSSPSSVLTFHNPSWFVNSTDPRGMYPSNGIQQRSIHFVEPTNEPINISQPLQSSCKSSCRLFGFSLTDDGIRKEDQSSNRIPSPVGMNPEAPSNLFHPNPPNCTNVSSKSMNSISLKGQ
ncbi:Auxin response factor 3 [Linum perenne]